MKKSKGLGDSIEKALKATGIDKVAKKVLGDDCGCEERKNRLNKMFPYARVFTEDEMKIYTEMIPALGTGKLKNDEYSILLKLYNKVFKANKTFTSCTSCVQATLNKLKKVYQHSCEL